MENVCDGRHDCEQGKDEGEICTSNFCEKLGRVLCPKSNGNICTKKENIFLKGHEGSIITYFFAKVSQNNHKLILEQLKVPLDYV